MAKQETFKVSKRGVEPVEITFDAPENLDDPRWDDLLSNKEEDINTLALQNLIIKIQSGARNRLEEGEDAVQEYVNSYKFGARVGGGGGSRKKPSLAADKARELGFSPEQLAALRAAGVEIPGLEDEDEGEE